MSYFVTFFPILSIQGKHMTGVVLKCLHFPPCCSLSKTGAECVSVQDY